MPSPLSHDYLPSEVYNVTSYRGIEYDSEQNRLVAAFDEVVNYPIGSRWLKCECCLDSGSHISG